MGIVRMVDHMVIIWWSYGDHRWDRQKVKHEGLIIIWSVGDIYPLRIQWGYIMGSNGIWSTKTLESWFDISYGKYRNPPKK